MFNQIPGYMPKNNYLKSKKVDLERSSSLKWDMLSRYLELGLVRYIVGKPFEIAFQRNLNRSIRSSDEEIRAKMVKVRKLRQTVWDRPIPLFASADATFSAKIQAETDGFASADANMGIGRCKYGDRPIHSSSQVGELGQNAPDRPMQPQIW